MAATTRAPRQSKEQAAAHTRQGLLEAGERLLLEQPVGAVLDQIKATDVARGAQKTIGAFYHHWATQAEFHDELIEHVLGSERLVVADVVAWVQQTIDSGVSLPELIRLIGHAAFIQTRDNPLLPLFVSLWAKQGHSERIGDLLRRNFDTTTHGTALAYQAVLDAYGLQMRPPFTVEHLSVVLVGLVQGLAIRATTDPAAVPLTLQFPDDQPPESDWDLFSAATRAIIDSLTIAADALPPTHPGQA